MEEVATVDSGDTAWMLTSTALVLMMTLPGLALFYGGMVRERRVLSVLAQVFAITCLVSMIWVIVGYSLSFGGGGALLGDLSKVGLDGVTVDAVVGTIPETVFVVFQMTFAIIAVALIVGAFVDRMKFAVVLAFSALWAIIVYTPVAHWVWGGGWISDLGALDFAGGTVVHINTGVAGLVAALVIGSRLGYGKEHMGPANLEFSTTGAALLWVGWFGFNAGSALTAGGSAGMAMLVTQIAAATAAISWMSIEWLLRRRWSLLGLLSGSIAGLVAITPASGYVGVSGAFIIGLAGGAGCYLAVTGLKRLFHYDDSLDVFGIHGVGGILGALLTGALAVESIGGASASLAQVGKQALGVAGTIGWSAAATLAILLAIRVVTPLRVGEYTELRGIDHEVHPDLGLLDQLGNGSSPGQAAASASHAPVLSGGGITVTQAATDWTAGDAGEHARPLPGGIAGPQPGAARRDHA